MLNRTLHKERTIAHWLSFDEPESRLRKAMKRERFFKEFGASEVQHIRPKPSFKLAALAFAMTDVDIFESICFKRAASVLSNNKQFQNFNTSDVLKNIDQFLEDHLRTALSWTEGEIYWAAISVEFLASVLSELQEDFSESQNEESAVIRFLFTVANRIESQIELDTDTVRGVNVNTILDIFDEHLNEMRSELPPEFLPERLLLVEGQTEAILVPLFAQLHGFDFIDYHILMISGGGANQVAKRFLSFRESTRLPIACLLDGDAESQFEIISQHLQHKDLIFSLPSGEFEDTFEITRFVQLLNRYLQSMTGESAPSLVEFAPLKKEQFPPELKRTQVLNRIWREKSLGDFDKVEFAEFVAQTIKTRGDVPFDFSSMIEAMEDKWGDPP